MSLNGFDFVPSASSRLPKSWTMLSLFSDISKHVVVKGLPAMYSRRVVSHFLRRRLELVLWNGYIVVFKFALVYIAPRGLSMSAKSALF